jgi:hypothetical protein
MPTTDRNDATNQTDSDKEKEDKEIGKGGKSKSSSKAKDLSHVPCKFFKVGSCTAGSSCPFSHTLSEPGGQKDVCAWFVKGNCKFGHKCALAHVLPGQSMAMDRKNKKAAQVAAGGGNAGGKDGKGGRGQKRDAPSNTGAANSASAANAQPRNPLLSGSTAPTRVLPASARPPITMPLKATISPSAPAPPLKDTDFASFGMPDELNKAQGRNSNTQPDSSEAPGAESPEKDFTQEIASHSPPSPLPLSTPTAPRRLGLAHQRSPNSVDFGPIGSPPRSSPSRPSRVSGFSPGTSPSQGGGFLSTSPFSAPGAQSVFLSYDKTDAPSDFKTRSGLAASLGATRTWNTEFGPVPSQISNRGLAGVDMLEDEDFEEFLPGSLSDLLTPEEKSRRMSRTNATRPVISGAVGGTEALSNVEGSQHRYSRSVPSQSLLGDIRSIWSDGGNGLPASPDTGASLNRQGLGVSSGLGSGTPSSYKSNSGFGGRSFAEDSPLSSSLLSPSNASAAFLPGMHHHYLNSKTGPQRSNLRAPGSSLLPQPMTSGSAGHMAGSGFAHTGSNGMALSPPSVNAFGNRPPFDTASSDQFYAGNTQRPPSGRPIPGGSSGFTGEGDDRRNALSPSARALQAHAPGQSLPQGLAAGYSRIHALPPPPSVPSPAGSGAFSPGQNLGYSPGQGGHEWSSNAAHDSTSYHGMVPSSPNSGLESVFSRLSYTATANRPSNLMPSTTSPNGGPPGISAPGITRNFSGRSWQGQGPLSPLSGPVVTGDDDDLFSMDG